MKQIKKSSYKKPKITYKKIRANFYTQSRIFDSVDQLADSWIFSVQAFSCSGCSCGMTM